MKELSQFRENFESALRGVINNWRVWLGNDELRAIHIGFDAYNTEISVSLLTDREPYIDEQQMEPLPEEDSWPTADWRLTCVTTTRSHNFPDAKDIMDWIRARSREIKGPALEDLNESLMDFFFEIATGPAVKHELGRFRKIGKPVYIRIEWLPGGDSLDHNMVVGDDETASPA